VVESRQEGKWTHYRLSEQGSAHAAQLLMALTMPNTQTQSCTICRG